MSRKTKSQGGSKQASNSEPPGFAPSTALVLCNQQCHLGSHTGRAKGDGGAEATPPGARPSPAGPFPAAHPRRRGCPRQCFVHLPVSASRFPLFSHLRPRLPSLPCYTMLGSHLRSARRPRTSPITPRRQHYLLPTAGKGEKRYQLGLHPGPGRRCQESCDASSSPRPCSGEGNKRDINFQSSAPKIQPSPLKV